MKHLNLAYSSVLPEDNIRSWESSVEQLLTKPEEPTPTPAQLASTVITQILANTGFATRRANRLSPVQVRQLRRRVGRFLTTWLHTTASRDVSDGLTSQEASAIILRMVLLEFAPEYLDIPYRDPLPLSEAERQQMDALQKTVKLLLRKKTVRGYSLSGVALGIVTEAFLTHYREQTRHYTWEDMFEAERTVHEALLVWRATLESTTAHPSVEECERGCPPILRVLLSRLKPDVFLIVEYKEE